VFPIALLTHVALVIIALVVYEIHVPMERMLKWVRLQHPIAKFAQVVSTV
jgi:hypothetical protein